MSRFRRIGLGLIIVAMLASTIGCSKWLDRFREKHPDPPPGVFPPRVGKMVIEVNERWGKNPNCTRADPLHCWGYYVDPGGDSEETRIHYYLQIFDSPDEANARLEALSRESVTDHDKISWENGVNKEGENIGRLMVRHNRYQVDDQLLGFCSMSYVKDVMTITIYHGYECDAAREFLKDLTAISD